MSATYLGSLTFGTAVGGVSADVTTLLSAVQLLLGRIDSLKASLEAIVTITGSLDAAIKLQLLTDIQLQLDANLAIGGLLDLTLKDPTIFLGELKASVELLALNLTTLLPQVALDVSVTANASAALELGAKKLAVEALLDLVGQISGVLNAAIAVALAAASLPAVQATASLQLTAAFTAGGVHAVRVSGPLATVGAELQGAVAGAGIGGAVTINTVVLFVESANAAGTAALDFAFVS